MHSAYFGSVHERKPAGVSLAEQEEARPGPPAAGDRPHHLTDFRWYTQVASRRRDLVGALAEDV